MQSARVQKRVFEVQKRVDNASLFDSAGESLPGDYTTLGNGTSFSHSRSEQTFQVHTDASVLGTGGVLMQEGRIVSYTSSKFAPAEFNYGTPEQELLGLVRALQVWRCYLEGAPDCELITDHHPLTPANATKLV